MYNKHFRSLPQAEQTEASSPNFLSAERGGHIYINKNLIDRNLNQYHAEKYYLNMVIGWLE